MPASKGQFRTLVVSALPSKTDMLIAGLNVLPAAEHLADVSQISSSSRPRSGLATR